MAILFATVFLGVLPVKAKQADTVYNSPYTSFSPDGKAWTTNAGDVKCVWYEKGKEISTGIPSSLRETLPGEHYYKVPRKGTVPIKYWRVSHARAACIHNSYPQGGWHGIDFGTSKCERYYYSGWQPYCADCGDEIVKMHFYMSAAAAESIDYLDVGTGLSYYYLCPHCRNLEQGSGIPGHLCNAVSWNRYQVRYLPNTNGAKYGGYMEDSIHMYNNATSYEGQSVTPVTRLTANSYTRIGYEFVEWNTEPDGSGMSYGDEAEIFNLTTENLSQGKGTVLLYAMWRPCVSNLQIDPAGGSYQGSFEGLTITGDYGSTYHIKEKDVEAPAGFTISFDTQGGEPVEPVTGRQCFVEWSMVQPFQGSFSGGEYSFTAPDGNTDILKAVYCPEPMTLPEAYKPGSAFGGWYYDEERREPAGYPGDTVIPEKNLTLYAQWVDLVLVSEEDYTQNQGSGAVNLSWRQADSYDKTYLLYQSKDGKNWTQIYEAEDEEIDRKVEKSFSYTGEERRYTIPYTGFYTLTAQGAQGASYGEYDGGLGGSVSGKFWMQKGEVLTFAVGGVNGYHGGGAATMYGNGGGCTTVSSDKKGILLIAGGGGGATAIGNGGAGGSDSGVLATGIEGENGGAGGGGGYRGGCAGEYIRHYHTLLSPGSNKNDCYARVPGYNLANRSFFSNVSGDPIYDTSSSGFVGISCHSADGSPVTTIEIGRRGQVLPTEGAGSVNIGMYSSCWGDCLGTASYAKLSLAVYNQNGTLIYYKKGFSGDGNNSSGPEVGHSNHYSSTTVTWDPSVTTGIYIVSRLEWLASDVWMTHQVTGVQFGEMVKKICVYEEGQVVSSKPAYGGSNFVNTDRAVDYDSDMGIRKGDGSFSIESEKIGYLETMELRGVPAPDLEPPEPIMLSTVQREPAGNHCVKVSWVKPADKGTDYYHVAESYLSGSEKLLCRSNITKNILKSGVCGYFWVLDGNRDTTADCDSAFLMNDKAVSDVTVPLSDTIQYLHVAPVDVAGNIGETVHIRIGSLFGAEDVRWKLYTEQLEIAQEKGVYPAGKEKTYYVCSDGETPITLYYSAYMDGPATADYQPNHIIWESQVENEVSKNIFTVPTSEPGDSDVVIPTGQIRYAAVNEPMMLRGAYTEICRKERSSRLAAEQQFIVSKEACGKTIRLTPEAGADYLGETVFSDSEMDKEHSLTLIGDGEAPVIKGLEVLENRELIDRREGEITLQMTAFDELSGVKDFSIQIVNDDNAVEKTYVWERDKSISITITEDDPLFSGDFTITAYAVDYVGNERVERYVTTEFALETKVERVLAPHTPIFRCGESGMLTITTWGYADRVEIEFPEEMKALNPNLGQVFTYEEFPRYRQEETVSFMIPLYTPENASYKITVRAYKGDKKLEEHPDISVIAVNGSVLDEIRTRLR